MINSSITITPDHYEQFYFSQGLKARNLVLKSGHTAIYYAGQIIGLKDSAIVESGLLTFKPLIKLTIPLKDMPSFDKMAALTRKYCSAPCQANTITEISFLFPPDTLTQIDATAIANKGIKINGL